MLKIAIDSGPIRSGSNYGMGTYVRELTTNLKNIDVIDFSKNLGAVSGQSYDILHFTSFRPFFVSIPFSKPKGKKFVLTIYDLIPLIYPKHYPPGIKGWINWQVNKYLIRKNINTIITISETSKMDICRFLGVDSRKVFVTYLAAPLAFRKLEIGNWKLEIAKRYNLPNHFALCDADIYYSKNVPNLVQACKLANIPLVLVGSGEKSINYAELHGFRHPELIHLKNVDWSDVHFLSSVNIEDLVKIYNLADVYIQPSFYEGFGIPILQAIACQVPVVVAKTQCLEEILGRDFEYVDPNDPKSIVKEMLNPNINKKLPREYSWEKTAKETQKVYESL